MSALHPVIVGFMPLLDSALLVVAKEKGFAAAEAIDLVLVRERSWANIRDRLAAGHFQAAHMLAPMPIACNLGLTPFSSRTIVPMALGLGGNAVTVSASLWRDMAAHGAGDDLDAGRNGRALAAVTAARSIAGKARLRFAVVHPHSAHHYELRYWLAASGVKPDHDIEIVILRPDAMAEALRSDEVDGYCVGEPWNSVAVASGAGRMATVKAAIWQSSPEKVLGADARWADEEPDVLAALVRAIYLAAAWCGLPANRPELAAILARPDYVGVPAALMLQALSGAIDVGGGATVQVSDFFIPFARGATFPWKSHALWFYSQMVRWGQVRHAEPNAAIARDTYRPDLYRRVLRPMGAALPGASAKVEGALGVATPVGASGAGLTLGPDGFFDGAQFDPDRLDAYIDAQMPTGRR
ncbi:CmpA/NrtA family ABC transporter substrate-binding protein [Marinivivus vitaminiproducens]|uniref:CmpA/NrtA family ABC transporter substrate-binding protein n=1 Tax=Marinivivus vitaminiproducens TaxID=3035935 RepID=UPI0027A089E4|nr:CmpA/NrtA family ABC transporter substrate-binding protein [Geminicoccaceae bacterium SCSIO 64248]